VAETPTTEPTAQVVTITPEIAVKMLEQNISNRPIRQPRVNLYAENMKRDKWTLTGEAIKIGLPDGDGVCELIDGQHRLWACVESGCSFRTWVMENVTADAKTFIDSGLPRSMGDVIGLAGMDHANHRASVARLILGWREGVLQNTNRWQAVVTRDRVLDFIRDNYEAQAEAIRTGSTVRRSTTGSTTAIAAFVFEIRRINSAKADEFIHAWITGEGLDAESPIRALRAWTMSRSANNKRTDNTLYLLTMTRAWNAFLVSGALRKMIVRKDDTIPDLHTGVTA
jgi:hypothetical protein